MSDIFKRKALDIAKPITADRMLIEWNGMLMDAVNVSLQYNQPINRRWTLGAANRCVIYPGRPSGQLSFARLITKDFGTLFTKQGFDSCDDPATIYLMLNGAAGLDNCSETGGTFIVSGAFVDSFGLQANSEDLSIQDNVALSFMQLDYNDK